MKTIPLFDDDKYIWKIYALANDNDCELLEFAEKLLASGNKDWSKMFLKLEAIASSEKGAMFFGDKFTHEIGSSKYRIFRFSQGALRISWFYGEGNKIILCAHAYIKKSNKTSRKDIEKAEGYYEASYKKNR